MQSDCPSSQYRNKTAFFLFHSTCKKMSLEHATWNFTEPGHGKQRSDGIGGSSKESNNREVSCGGDVLCALDFLNVLRNKNGKIHGFQVTQENIEYFEKFAPKNLKPTPETTLIHQVVWNAKDKEQLTFRYLSCSECNTENCIHYNLRKSLTSYAKVYVKNDWVAVIFDGIWYPGLISEVQADTFIIKFMNRKQKSFFWPKKEEREELHRNQILCKIEEPKQVSIKNKKNIFTFTDKEYERIEELLEKCEIYE